MENNYFLLSPQHDSIVIERFHLCTWEMRNETAWIEFGVEISPIDKFPNQLEFSIYVPWIKQNSQIYDLYDKLKDESNCRFIFNDSVEKSEFIKDENCDFGTIQHLTDHGAFCIVPIKPTVDPSTKEIRITIETKLLKNKYRSTDRHIYFRFYLEPHISLLTTRTRGITKTSLIYDIKINEKRNLPSNLPTKNLCRIDNCFVFHIVPNSYELIFLDNKTCKGIRSLEFDSFRKYLPHKKFRRDELVVIFNKKSKESSYTFFSSYTKERISPTQIVSAIFINLLCALLLFIANIRTNLNISYYDKDLWKNLPWEAYLCMGVVLLTGMYIFWPSIRKCFHSRITKVNR